MVASSRIAALAALLAALAAWTTRAVRRQPCFVTAGAPFGVQAGRGSAGPAAFASEASACSAPAARAASSAGNVLLASCAAALLASLAARRRLNASRLRLEPAARVTMCARSPSPTTPVGTRGKRRIRAGRMRPIFRGRQIAVRVNPKTNKPIRYRMHVVPGDAVQVMKGKDAGKVTTVLRVYPKWNKILCLGVNYCIKHVRPMRDDEVGQRVQVEAPMHSSCVMHYSETEGVAGLLGIKFVQKEGKDGITRVKKVRFNKATGEEIPVGKPQKWVPVLDRDADDEE